MSIIPQGLFVPYTPVQGKLSRTDISVPLLSILVLAVISSIPVFQMKDVWPATLYTFVSFILLCHLRWAVVRWFSYPTENGPYLSPSAIFPAEMLATLLAMAWVAASFKGAHLIWGWQLH